MRMLIISVSPLERVGQDYYAVDTWIMFPAQLARHCDVTLWSPVSVLPPGTTSHRDSWRVPVGTMTIEPMDKYHSFVTYYRLWWRRFWVWWRQAKSLIAEHDVVVLRLPAPLTQIVLRACRLLRKPLILLVAGNIATQSDRLLHSRGLKRLLYKALVSLIVRAEMQAADHARVVYVYSDELALRHARHKDHVLRMRTPHLNQGDFVERTDTCRSREIRLLRVAWLLPSKGYEYLFEAVALLLQRGYAVSLEIVGKEREAGYQASLERYAERLGIREHVVFTGWVPFDHMGEAYVRNDIQVISSLSEGTPRCIVEGFARGLPLVCTAVGGCTNAVSDSVNGLLVPPADPEAMAGAVARMIEDGTLRRHLIAAGYESAKSVTFETLGKQFLSEVQALVDPSGGGQRFRNVPGVALPGGED